MDIYEEIVKLRQQGRRAAIATIVNVRGSIPSFQTAKMLVRDDGSMVGTVGGGCVKELRGSQAAHTVAVQADCWRMRVQCSPFGHVLCSVAPPRVAGFRPGQNPSVETTGSAGDRR